MSTFSAIANLEVSPDSIGYVRIVPVLNTAASGSFVSHLPVPAETTADVINLTYVSPITGKQTKDGVIVRLDPTDNQSLIVDLSTIPTFTGTFRILTLAYFNTGGANGTYLVNFQLIVNVVAPAPGP